MENIKFASSFRAVFNNVLNRSINRSGDILVNTLERNKKIENKNVFNNLYTFIKNKFTVPNFQEKSVEFVNIQECIFNNLEIENKLKKSQKVKQVEVIEDEFICDDPVFICILKNINIFIEEHTYKLLFYILLALLILLTRIFSIYRNQNSKNKKKMNLKEFIKFLKKNYPYLVYLFYILLLFLFIILLLNISKKLKKYGLNIYKGMENLYKTYKRLLRLFSKVEFLEKLQKLGFDKLNQDVESIFDMVNYHLAEEIINLKKEVEQIKKEIIDINSNIIIF